MPSLVMIRIRFCFHVLLYLCEHQFLTLHTADNRSIVLLNDMHKRSWAVPQPVIPFPSSHVLYQFLFGVFLSRQLPLRCS